MALHSRNLSDAGPTAGLSLCAGYAGLDLGLMLAEPGYRTVGFVEREAHAAAALVARMEDEALDQAPIWDDLASFDGRPWRGKVDLVAAGYPCQPFSIAGKRGGAEDPRHLWPHVARIIRESGPRWAFLENVEGHLALGCRDVVRELQDMGFDVEAGVFSAYEVGSPQWRRRVFILAHADGGEHGVQAGDRYERRLSVLPARRGTVRTQRSGSAMGTLRHDGAQLGASPLGSAAELPVFAPGPGALREWWDVLDRRPDLKPELRRVDDGLAERVDRCRAAGNGVVPLAAAVAFRSLKARLMAPKGKFEDPLNGPSNTEGDV